MFIRCIYMSDGFFSQVAAHLSVCLAKSLAIHTEGDISIKFDLVSGIITP